jgi:hypothetical protein
MPSWFPSCAQRSASSSTLHRNPPHWTSATNIWVERHIVYEASGLKIAHAAYDSVSKPTRPRRSDVRSRATPAITRAIHPTIQWTIWPLVGADCSEKRITLKHLRGNWRRVFVKWRRGWDSPPDTKIPITCHKALRNLRDFDTANDTEHDTRSQGPCFWRLLGSLMGRSQNTNRSAKFRIAGGVPSVPMRK